MRVVAAAVLGCAAAYSLPAHADNPIVQTLYTADPAPMVYNERLYVYTGHDEDTLVNNFFTMNDWRVYSTTDMVNWADHGSPLRYSSFSWSKGDAWAGQVIYRSGRFYYYVPTTSRSLGRMVIGVAVSNNPAGPFTDALGKPLIAADCGEIDPTVFIDDDGQAYLYWGNPKLCYVKLNADMTSYSGSVVHVPMTTASFGTRTGDASRATLYEEGPWFYKRGSLYYMLFAAGGIPEYIAYSTSSSPTGPWTYQGVIMPNQGASFTNHPGVVDYQGNSYFFYHNGALPGGGGYHRSVAVEQFTYKTDGKWPTINMTTGGPAGTGDLDPYAKQEAETIAWESGVETEVCSEGGMNVTAVGNGDYIKIKGVSFGSGATSFDARVASATSGGKIELRLDSQSGTLVGTCSVQGTGGWQSWTTVNCPVNGATGKHDLFLKFTGGSGDLFNLNWWKFNGPSPADGGTTDGATDRATADGSAPDGGADTGAPGSGGMVSGSGGNVSGSGGAAGSGGAMRGTGGSVSGSGGMAGSLQPDAGAAGAGGGLADGSGCGCRSVGDTSVLALLLVIPAFAWRRRGAQGTRNTVPARKSARDQPLADGPRTQPRGRDV